LRKDADSNVTRHSTILAEDGALTRVVDRGRFFYLQFAFCSPIIAKRTIKV
jgi:hypothetical protein